MNEKQIHYIAAMRNSNGRTAPFPRPQMQHGKKE